MLLEIPDTLNGKTFYGEILPSIYQNIIRGNYSIDFDMHRTELANPEGLVNLLAAAAMIRSKSGFIPTLFLPESPYLFEYMRKSGFFDWAIVPGCEALRIKGYMDINSKDGSNTNNRIPPQFFGVYTHSNEGTTFNRHIARIENFVSEIGIECKIPYIYCRRLSDVLIQVIKNSLEHNLGYKGALAYYMMQKTPYNTIEFVCSDIGKGFLDRMKEMLREKDPDAVAKYGYLEPKLNNREFLFQEHIENPNLLAITHAVRFREDSEVPGLHTIKEFVTDYDGLFSIHSGNYTVIYRKGKEVTKVFHEKSYFSGGHVKMVLNLPNQNQQE